MAAAAQRSAARLWRRNRRDGRSIPGRDRSGRTVPLFRRTSLDCTNYCGCQSLFQHHASPVDRLYRRRSISTAGLSSRRRRLFIWRRQPGGIFLQSAMDGARLCRISAADRLGGRLTIGDPARLAQPSYLRVGRDICLHHTSLVVITLWRLLSPSWIVAEAF